MQQGIGSYPLMIHHQPAPATAVMAMDITTDSAISFAHSL